MEKEYGFLKSMKMPKYSKGEEIFNLVSHIVGGGFGIGVLILFFILNFINHYNLIEFVSLIIYSISIILLYTMSSLYHGLKANCTSKKVLRILDHCTIYFLICGTYTPICIFKFYGTVEGNLILLFEWFLCILGIVLNALWLNNKFVKFISILLYAFTGWMIVLIPGAICVLSFNEFVLILLGGIVYTIGILFYALGKKKKWSHSIFHILCVIATIFQFFGILLMI